MFKGFSKIFIACSLVASSLVSCGESDIDRLSAHPWESSVGFIEFKESGKICYNFESEDASVSYYKLLSGDRINMYTEEGEEFGLIFDYRFEGDSLYIGEAEYKKFEQIEFEDDETTADGASNPEDYPEVSLNTENK